jgi:hypothetical protein
MKMVTISNGISALWRKAAIQILSAHHFPSAIHFSTYEFIQGGVL